MKFTIWVRQEVDIPDDEVKSLIRKTNKRFGIKPTSSPVYPEDFVTQAMLDGVVERIDESWHVDESESDDMVDESIE